MALAKSNGLNHISIKGLFGIYDHDIKLNTGGFTILYGPNGVGKTVILKIIHSFFSGQFGVLFDYPFESICFQFSDSSMLSIFQILHGHIRNEQKNAPKIKLVYTKGESSKECELNGFEVAFLEREALQIESNIPYLDRIDEGKWVDMRNGEVLSTEELVQKYRDNKKLSQETKNNWLKNLAKSITTCFIKTQRLETANLMEPRWNRRVSIKRPTVVEYAEKMKQIIAKSLSAYAKESQLLDQSFPNRLIKETALKYSRETLASKMEEITQKRKRLETVGLLEEEGISRSHKDVNIMKIEEIGDSFFPVMSLYADDTLKKLGSLDDLYERVNILITNVNKKFRHKRLGISKDDGLSIYGKDDEKLNIEALSSGEQHEVVLFFGLLFNVPENALILIDEPELSLHLAWQKTFLKDIEPILKLRSFDLVIATHSSYVVEDYRDCMVELS